MLVLERGGGMNSDIDEISLLRQAQRHHHLVGVSQETAMEEQEEHKHFLVSHHPHEDQEMPRLQPAKRKKKVVKKWRDEWAQTYNWAQFRVVDGTARNFCFICSEYGRKHERRFPLSSSMVRLADLNPPSGTLLAKPKFHSPKRTGKSLLFGISGKKTEESQKLPTPPPRIIKSFSVETMRRAAIGLGIVTLTGKFGGNDDGNGISLAEDNGLWLTGPLPLPTVSNSTN